MTWLEPARSALDAAAEPVRFFLRDDDAGWADRRLFALADLVAARGLPLDLAVIPTAVDRLAAAELVNRIDGGADLGLHQHGFTHANHEPEGRKCEFGSARTRTDQRRDISAGRRALAERFGSRVDAIFTPPWNRCTRETGEVLAELGFEVLSRESRAEPLAVAGLRELPVAIDWFAKRKGKRLEPLELGELLARAIASPGPVGVMFHHAVMDASERDGAAQLLDLLATHPAVTVIPMRILAAEPVAAAA
jgi:hypothetical protein